jgi:hypothetical protein
LANDIVAIPAGAGTLANDNVTNPSQSATLPFGYVVFPPESAACHCHGWTRFGKISTPADGSKEMGTTISTLK